MGDSKDKNDIWSDPLFKTANPKTDDDDREGFSANPITVPEKDDRNTDNAGED